MASPTQAAYFPGYTSLFCGKQKDKTAYMRRPPRIAPNYGRSPTKSMLPKSYVARVILYENSLQQNMLNAELKEMNWKIRQIKSGLYKKKYTFIAGQKKQQKLHEVWDTGYQRTKDAFVARFGDEYIPLPTPEPEENPFFTYAGLLPVINVLYFYLDALDETGGDDVSHDNNQETTDTPSNQPTTNPDSDILQDHDHLIKLQEKLKYDSLMQDPRFKNLQGSLISPESKNDGYLQLSPTYHPKEEAQLMKKTKPKKKVMSIRQRDMILPKFYTEARRRAVSLDSEPRSSDTDVQEGQLGKGTRFSLTAPPGSRLMKKREQKISVSSY